MTTAIISPLSERLAFVAVDRATDFIHQDHLQETFTFDLEVDDSSLRVAFTLERISECMSVRVGYKLTDFLVGDCKDVLGTVGNCKDVLGTLPEALRDEIESAFHNKICTILEAELLPFAEKILSEGAYPKGT